MKNGKKQEKKPIKQKKNGKEAKTNYDNTGCSISLITDLGGNRIS